MSAGEASVNHNDGLFASRPLEVPESECDGVPRLVLADWKEIEFVVHNMFLITLHGMAGHFQLSLRIRLNTPLVNQATVPIGIAEQARKGTPIWLNYLFRLTLSKWSGTSRVLIYRSEQCLCLPGCVDLLRQVTTHQ